MSVSLFIYSAIGADGTAGSDDSAGCVCAAGACALSKIETCFGPDDLYNKDNAIADTKNSVAKIAVNLVKKLPVPRALKIDVAPLSPPKPLNAPPEERCIKITATKKIATNK